MHLIRYKNRGMTNEHQVAINHTALSMYQREIDRSIARSTALPVVACNLSRVSVGKRQGAAQVPLIWLVPSRREQVATVGSPASVRGRGLRAAAVHSRMTLCCELRLSLLFYTHVLNKAENLEFSKQHSSPCGRDSSVGVTTRYGLDGPGIESRRCEIFQTRPDRPWDPPSFLYNGYRVLSRG
jgi:hypothetical protein